MYLRRRKLNFGCYRAYDKETFIKSACFIATICLSSSELTFISSHWEDKLNALRNLITVFLWLILRRLPCLANNNG